RVAASQARTLASSHARQAEQLPRILHRRWATIELHTLRNHLLHQRGVGRGKRLPIHANVVFQPGAAMPAELERPAHECELVAPYSSAGPRRLGRKPAQRTYNKTRTARDRPASRS